MKRLDVKSDCPINYTMEIFGDPWSMIIVRELANYGPLTFGELLSIEERIGTSVLTNSLKHLETRGIISKTAHPDDKRRFTYRLATKGLDVLPMLYEISAFGSRHSNHPKASPAWFRALSLDRDIVISAWRSALEADCSFLNGPKSVVKQLQL